MNYVDVTPEIPGLRFFDYLRIPQYFPDFENIKIDREISEKYTSDIARKLSLVWIPEDMILPDKILPHIVVSRIVNSLPPGVFFRAGILTSRNGTIELDDSETLQYNEQDIEDFRDEGITICGASVEERGE